MPVFSLEDLTFFKNQGYVIAHNAVPQEDLDALLAMFDELIGLAPETWYKPPHHEGSFVEAYQQQALWNTRQGPRVVEAFREVLGTQMVFVGVDRASMKLPMNPAHPGFGGALQMHWDISMKKPTAGWGGLQGVLAITDTDEDMGGFACVPGSHINPEALAAKQSAEFDGLFPAPTPDLAGQAIPMRAGDLLIWTPRLLHGSLANRSTRPRLAQYIKFSPGRKLTPEELARNAKSIAALTPMAGWKKNPEVEQPREWACRPKSPPVFTELGRKVAGLESW